LKRQNIEYMKKVLVKGIDLKQAKVTSVYETNSLLIREAPKATVDNG